MIIYLNGTSSAGKTTLARELQALLPEPYFYFSIDTLLYALPQVTLGAIKEGGEHFMDWGRVFDGYLGCVWRLHEAGNPVIADLPIYNPMTAELFRSHLPDRTQVLRVGLHCPLEVLREREEARGDRVPGLAERQFAGIHTYMKYDVELETKGTDPKVLAQNVVTYLRDYGVLKENDHD